MRALFLVIDLALELYIWIVIAAAIFSWLVAFHVVNTRNQVVGMIGEFLYRITEPALRSAMVYGSVLASFTVERFGVERLATITRREITARAKQFARITTFKL